MLSAFWSLQQKSVWQSVVLPLAGDVRGLYALAVLGINGGVFLIVCSMIACSLLKLSLQEATQRQSLGQPFSTRQVLRHAASQSFRVIGGGLAQLLYFCAGAAIAATVVASLTPTSSFLAPYALSAVALLWLAFNGFLLAIMHMRRSVLASSDKSFVRSELSTLSVVMKSPARMLGYALAWLCMVVLFGGLMAAMVYGVAFVALQVGVWWRMVAFLIWGIIATTGLSAWAVLRARFWGKYYVSSFQRAASHSIGDVSPQQNDYYHKLKPWRVLVLLTVLLAITAIFLGLALIYQPTIVTFLKNTLESITQAVGSVVPGK